jgi:acyl-CoA synthetase (AMP-forming)/AMP-acid ligase II
MNIVSRFIEAAEKNPETIAIIEGDEKITYHQLLMEVKQCAQQLKKSGLNKGDSMIIFIPMGIELYRTVLACFYIGAIAVFVDEWVSLKRLEMCCEIANCKGFAGTWKARLIRIISKEIRNIPVNFKYKNELDKLNELVEVNPDDTALITFTTGSTGIPKAANRTHQFLEEQLNILIDELKPQPNEVSMPLLPIVLLINLSSGTTSVIASFKANKPKKLNPLKILEQIEKHKVKMFISSPFVVVELAKKRIEQPSNSNQFPKNIFTGGAPVFPNEAELINKGFPNSNSTVFYGSTESEPISKINTKELEVATPDQLEKGLPVGQIHVKTETRILSIDCKISEFSTVNDFNLQCLSVGEIGEIIVTGPHVLKHYINNPEAEKANKINVNGVVWHRTGDSGYTNKKNELFLTGRVKQIIKINDFTFYPFIEEYKIKQIGGINLGTILHANNQLSIFIEPIKNANLSEIKSKLQELYKGIPSKIIFTEIPRDSRHFSKIDYGKLMGRIV